jgi:transcriptional regulator with XRE-family HTH domain
MKIQDFIKMKRKSLGETQGQFAKRFNTSITAISLWESGKRQAPYNVIEFCFTPVQVKICPTCQGKGTTI